MERKGRKVLGKEKRRRLIFFSETVTFCNCGPDSHERTLYCFVIVTISGFRIGCYLLRSWCVFATQFKLNHFPRPPMATILRNRRLAESEPSWVHIRHHTWLRTNKRSARGNEWFPITLMILYWDTNPFRNVKRETVKVEKTILKGRSKKLIT